MRYAWILIITLAAVHAAAAQQPDERRSIESLPDATRPFLVSADPTLVSRAEILPDGRVDAESGVYRAVYRIPATTPVLDSADETTRAYMQAEKTRFGWPSTNELLLVSEHVGRSSTHLTYRQTLSGVPVYNRYVKASLDSDGHPTMVISGYAPHVGRISGFGSVPRVDAEEASRLAGLAISEQGAHTHEPELVVYPIAQPRLAWHIIVWPDTAGGEWDVLLDATSGIILHVMDRAVHLHAEYLSTKNPGLPDGSGLVFDPDPLTSSGSTYSSEFYDRNDADALAINSERVEVTLRDITRGSDGLYRLQGPYVIIDGTRRIGGTASNTPAESDPGAFRYTRANDFFEAVMAYYHIDTSQRYIQSLGLGFSPNPRPVRVNPHGLGSQDNSQFLPGIYALAFGDGGIDDAEDAEVILHEYGHALLEAHAPGLLDGAEGSALHEGWSDYWAVSYTRGLMDAGAVPSHDWRHVFSWDGNATWEGRRLDRLGTYPEDTQCDVGACSSQYWYSDGVFWATAVMEIYEDLGKDITDRLHLYSHLYLSRPVTFLDAAEAIAQADVDLFEGIHLTSIVRRFGGRNLLNAAEFGPAVVHDPLESLDAATMPVVEITAEVTPRPADITSVRMLHSTDGAPFETLELTPAGIHLYSGSLPLQPAAMQMAYYLEAADKGGFVARLPANAPASTYRVRIGRDTHAPEIHHQPLAYTDIEDWPPGIEADVTDDQGIDSVWASFEILSREGVLRGSGTFQLAAVGGGYAGRFPDNIAEPGNRVRYRIRARDIAGIPNEAALPPEGAPAFPLDVVEDGALLAYTFEKDGVLAPNGYWDLGAPSYGLLAAHSGSGAWITNPAGSYPGAPTRASLEFSAPNLDNHSSLYLEFWHWHDFEHEGIEGPGPSATGALHDGGNVKVSYDAGGTWALLHPDEGYTGPISGGRDNPMEHEPAFGGYSFGWRRVRMQLSGDEDVRIRFELGTDQANSHSSRYAYAGWALDDVRMLVRKTVDAAPPVISRLPEALQIAPAGALPPPITVEAEDHPGVDSALLDYTYDPRGTDAESGTVRLEMAPFSLTTFTGTIPLRNPMSVGSRITYRMRFQDFDGNTVVAPPVAEAPLVIEARLAEELSALAGALATGHWKAIDTGYGAHATGDPGVSSILLGPFDLPKNATKIAFELSHSYRLGAAAGANVKLRDADSGPWSVLLPEVGYSGLVGPGHALDGQPGWTGDARHAARSDFDLAHYAGRQVRMRLDFGTSSGSGANDFWQINAASLGYSTPEESFGIERELALHANFPDPFADHTSIQYTLSETSSVLMEVYNILGQRVSVLVNTEQSAASYTISFLSGDLAGGLYFLRMTAGERQVIEPMILAR